MKLTTKGRYAVTALVDIACHQGTAPVRLADIAARQQIPLTFLEQISSQLRLRGLLKSVRGPGGGYFLNKEAAQISILDIIVAVDEPLDSTQCGGEADCQDGQMCLTHHLWEEFSNKLKGFLQELSLEALANRPSVKHIASRQSGLTQTLHLKSLQSCLGGN